MVFREWSTLDTSLKTKTKNQIDEILMSVNGTLSNHQQAFLGILMNQYNSLKKYLAEIETALEEDMRPFTAQVKQRSNIYDISTTASCYNNLYFNSLNYLPKFVFI